MEADARRQADEAERARVAALKAEEERRVKAAAEAEARRQADEAERVRVATLKAEEERRAKATPEARSGFGETRRGWLGVRIQQVTDEIAGNVGIKPARGAMIAGLDDKSPLKSAGIEVGDVIVKFDGRDIREMRDLPRIVANTPAGKNVAVVIIRKGNEETKVVRIGLGQDAPRDEIVIRGRSPFVGAKVANLSPSVVDELRLDTASEGVAIVEVVDGSPAQRVGLRRGDVVVTVNNERVAKTLDLDQLSKLSTTENRIWRVTIIRGGQQISVVLQAGGG